MGCGIDAPTGAPPTDAGTHGRPHPERFGAWNVVVPHGGGGSGRIALGRATSGVTDGSGDDCRRGGGGMRGECGQEFDRSDAAGSAGRAGLVWSDPERRVDRGPACVQFLSLGTHFGGCGIRAGAPVRESALGWGRGTLRGGCGVVAGATGGASAVGCRGRTVAGCSGNSVDVGDVPAMDRWGRGFSLLKTGTGIQAEAVRGTLSGRRRISRTMRAGCPSVRVSSRPARR